MIKDNKIKSYIYNVLLKTYEPNSKGIRKKIWDLVWKYAKNNFTGPVSTNIHGKRMLINFGHSYQFYARKFKNWNDPLIELAYLCFEAKGSPITLADIGASIGDTIRLLEINCPDNTFEHFICVEGDREFFSLLKENLDDDIKYTLIEALLSDKSEEIPSLIRTHPGTATAQGKTTVTAKSLDSIFDEHNFNSLDLIKIDVDGFDGKVIKGSKRILDEFHPCIIFEWDPKHCKNTNNNWLEHFHILENSGYSQFIWFNKYGHFSHFMNKIDVEAINLMAELCLSDELEWNWHFDIIALHNTSEINAKELATLKHAKARCSWY